MICEPMARVLCIASAATALAWGDFRTPKLAKNAKPSKYALAPPTTAAQGFVIREKLFSISGEDFTIEDEAGQPAFDVVGSNKVPFGLGGFVLDKLELRVAGARKICASIERRAVALATAYDVYLDGECIAKIERDVVSLTPSYKFFYEAENDGNPCYRASGSFSERRYDIYARDGSEVATIGRQLFELLEDTKDTYHLRVAAGVDAAAIVALAVVIDEDHDEADAKKAKEEKEEGGWFGR